MEEVRTSQMSFGDTKMEDMHDNQQYIEDAANAAVASVDANHFSNYISENPDTTQESINISKGSTVKVKRAKSTQKITRNRKITSCLQCRERKQKCDRQRPICSNCSASQSRGGMCTYLDTNEAIQETLAQEGERNAKRTKRRSSYEYTNGVKSEAGPSQLSIGASHISTSLAMRRLNLISATQKAGRDRSLDFEIRVRCSRAAAVGSVLFGTPQNSRSKPFSQSYSPPAAVNTLKLPTASEIAPLLDIYRSNVEWMCNVVVIDLNRARIANFLDWYHNNPQTLPADPPLVPLVLVILALAIQARRTIGSDTPHMQRQKGRTLEVNDVKNDTKAENTLDGGSGSGGMPRSRAHSPKDDFFPYCSSEKELLETAGRCIDSLQIACPSNWASAYSAPLDLVRANLLRGLWHLSELHLQFAGSCFAVTTRLAHAAALNRDTRHWHMMGKEEAQARRNIFWNVTTLEMLHSARVIQPAAILPGGYDTLFPRDHDALLALYKRAGLIEPYIVDGRRSSIRVEPVSRSNFDFHLARFQLTDVLIKGVQVGKSNKLNGSLAEEFENWKRDIPKSLEGVLEKDELGVLGGESPKKLSKMTNEEEVEAETRYLQESLLQMMSLSTEIQIHRPQVDDTGTWRPPEGQAQKSLELCIDSAQRQIWLVSSILGHTPGPPFVMYNFCIFYCFQAAIILAIQSALCGNFNDPMAFAVLARPSLDKAVRTLDLVASRDGLRLVAEQASRYSDTLREIDVAQQRSKNEESSLVTKGNDSMGEIPGAFIGAPPPIIVEGSGKRLGGQGYPTRHVSRSTSPQRDLPAELSFSHLPSSSSRNDNQNGTKMSANQFDSTGFDFSDLGLMPIPIETNSSTGEQGHPYAPLVGEYYGERSLHQVDDNLQSANLPLRSQINTQAPTGLDLLAAQVEQARHLNHQTAPWVSATEGAENESNYAHSDLGALPNTEDWTTASSFHVPTVQAPLPPPPPSASYDPHQIATLSDQDQLTWPKEEFNSRTNVIPASAPAVESLGETFATDWSEWERVVNRLLHSD